jgi:hypothetical protein
MDEDMKENIFKIRKMDRENLIGQMVGPISVNGKMANNTEKEST